jgi:hypothetical protein
MTNDLEARQPKTTLRGPGETQQSLDSTIRERLFRLCELYGREANPVAIPIWYQAVAGLSLEVIRRGFDEIEKTFVPTAACPFPTPAHLLRFIAEKKENSASSEAELAWQRALTLRRTEWNPDISGGRFAELISGLPVQEQQACRASGIFNQPNMEPDQLHVWAKKRFLEAYGRWTEHAADILLLENGPVKDALKTAALALALPVPKRNSTGTAPLKLSTRDGLPPMPPKKYEHPPKSARGQPDELKDEDD